METSESVSLFPMSFSSSLMLTGRCNLILSCFPRFESEKVGLIIVGLPKNMDGSLGPSAAKAQSFASRLATELVSIKILLWDERLTTVEAQRALHLAGKKARQSKKMIDQVAAQILLQSYLDSLQWTNTKRDGESSHPWNALNG